MNSLQIIKKAKLNTSYKNHKKIESSISIKLLKDAN
jgi:hypothetical protein